MQWIPDEEIDIVQEDTSRSTLSLITPSGGPFYPFFIGTAKTGGHGLVEGFNDTGTCSTTYGAFLTYPTTSGQEVIKVFCDGHLQFTQLAGSGTAPLVVDSNGNVSRGSASGGGNYVNISNSLTYTFTGGTSPAVVCTTGTCIVTGNPQTITASGITGYHALKVNFNGTQNSNSGGEELNVILNADTTGGDYTSVFSGGAGGGNCNYLCAGFLSSLSGGGFYPGGGSFEIIGLDDTGNGFVSLNGTESLALICIRLAEHGIPHHLQL